MLLCLSFYLNTISLCYYHKLVLGNISHNQISTSTLNITITFRHGRLVEVGVNNGVVLLLGAVLLLILALLQLRQGRDDSYAQAGDDDGDVVVDEAVKVQL